MIGVNLISIYSLFCMYFCNLNARFTPIFLKITLIPHLLMFCRTRRKIKQNEERNQVKRKLLSCSRLLAAAKGSPLRKKGFTAGKPKKAKLMSRVHNNKDTLRCSEDTLRCSEEVH